MRRDEQCHTHLPSCPLAIACPSGLLPVPLALPTPLVRSPEPEELPLVLHSPLQRPLPPPRRRVPPLPCLPPLSPSLPSPWPVSDSSRASQGLDVHRFGALCWYGAVCSKVCTGVCLCSALRPKPHGADCIVPCFLGPGCRTNPFAWNLLTCGFLELNIIYVSLTPKQAPDTHKITCTSAQNASVDPPAGVFRAACQAEVTCLSCLSVLLVTWPLQLLDSVSRVSCSLVPGRLLEPARAVTPAW